MTQRRSRGNYPYFCKVWAMLVSLLYDVIERFLGIPLYFATMEEIKRKHRTIHLQDVMEIVRNPSSGFDPEPVTISQVGYLFITYSRNLQRIPWLSVLTLLLSVKKEESTVTEIIMTMQKCLVNRWLPWD